MSEHTVTFEAKDIEEILALLRTAHEWAREIVLEADDEDAEDAEVSIGAAVYYLGRGLREARAEKAGPGQ